MVALVDTLEGTIARLVSQLGVSWPNAWWPGGNDGADNDCAAFQSWGLWGLNANNAPYQYNVSGVIERSGLPFHAGNQGIQRGDIPGFRWSTAVNYDHIGMALASPNSAGWFKTIDANGPTNKVAYTMRNISDVHNFVRPNYPTTGTAGGDATPINNSGTEYDMTGFAVIKFATTKEAFTIDADGRLVHLPPEAGGPAAGRSEAIACAQAQQAAAYEYSDDDFMRNLWLRGHVGLDWTTIKATVAAAPGTVFPAPQPPAAPLTLTDAQVAAIAAGIKIPPVDLSALTSAIAAVQTELATLDTQADGYQAALLATLAKGLTITGTATPNH